MKALVVLSFLALVASRSPAGLSEPVVISCTAQDGVAISAYWYGAGTRTARPLVLMMPGYAQRHGLLPMSFVTSLLTPTADVLLVNARGTGKSGSAYTFGAREHWDLAAAWNALPQRYGKRYLLGFSLGSYIALRAATEGGLKPDAVLLVSCPTRVEKIVYSGGAVVNPFAMLFQKKGYAVAHQNDIFFRWHWPFLGKPKATEFAGTLACPVHFLSGKRDLLVFNNLSREVFDASPNPKFWEVWPDGLHAEAMALQHPEAFQAWVKQALN